MIKNIYLVIAFALFLPAMVLAQANLYTANSFTKAYTPLTDATDLDLASTGEKPYVLPIGFEFSIADKTTTELRFLETGTLHTHTPYSPETASIVLANLGLFPRIGTDSQLSFIRYKTEGEVGERIFKLEFVNFGFLKEVQNTQQTNSYINYQMWIYETTNTVELLFGDAYFPDGAEAVTDTGRPTFGLVNEWYQETETFTDIWAAIGDINTPTIFHATQITDEESVLLSSIPNSGNGVRIAHPTTSTTTPSVEPIVVYPSISHDNITVQGDFTNSSYQIINSYGQVLQQGIIATPSININQLAKGMYLLQITGDTPAVFQGRFMKL